jgi:O-antigen ligase
VTVLTSRGARTPAAWSPSTRPAPRPFAIRCLLALLWGYPLWWLLGINAFLWAVVAVPAGLFLLDRRRPTMAPRGFGLWLLFLGWVVLSAVRLPDLERGAAAVFRGASYVAAAVLLLLVMNATSSQLSTRTLVHAMTALWAWATGLAVVALFIPTWSMVSPTEMLLPDGLVDSPFVRTLVHPSLATIDPLLETARPRPLFSYTNNWGSAVALLTPVAVYAMLTARTRHGKALLGLALVVSLVPITASLNRGLWISLTAGVLYVVGRLAMRRRAAPLGAVLTLAALLAAALVTTPLGDLVTQRLDSPNTTTRETLYAASLEAATRSPIIGYGAPVSSEGLVDSNDVSIGTHGQFWTVLVSQGFPGAALFVGFLALMGWRTRHVSDQLLWLHAVVVVLLVQLPYYDPLPAGLVVTFLCAALCLRLAVQARPRPGARSTGGGEPFRVRA